jgi:hypothetical protein
VAAYRDLKALYHPYAKRFTKQGLARSFFKAGEEYVIWMRFNDHDMLNIAFSLGIEFERGNDDYGRLISDR